MARPKSPAPKKQRGISFSQDVYSAVEGEVAKYGGTFNGVVESLVRNALLGDASKVQKLHQTRNTMTEDQWHDDTDDDDD